ncbi:MAG: hypothetical protein K6F32_01990 [Bacilli bacterium]|nr:hypothetical protein [Bacilli bacterium]
MDYRDAVREFERRHGLSGFANRFLVRSILSDCVGASVTDKRLIDALFELSLIFDVVAEFQSVGLNKGRKKVAELYDANASLNGRFSTREVIDAVNPITELVCPSEFKSSRGKRNKKAGGAVVVKKQRSEHVGRNTPLIHKSAPIPQKATPPKKASPAKRTAAIDNITLSVNAAFFTMAETDDKQLSVLIDGKRMKLDSSHLSVTGDGLVIPIDSPRSDVRLVLPKKRYDTVTIAAGDTNIFYNGTNDKRMRFKNLRLSARRGVIYVSAIGESLDIQLDQGNITIGGDFAKANAQVQSGLISVHMWNRLHKDVSLNLMAKHGKISGGFFQGKLKPSFHRFMRKTYAVQQICMAENVRVDLNLKAGNGISLK